MTDSEIVKTWLQYYREANTFGRDDPIVEKYFIGYEMLDELCWNDPVRAFKIVKDIFETNPEERIIYNLAAGPLEDLLVRHGNEMIQPLKKYIEKNPNFLVVLEGVWLDRIAQDVQVLLQDLVDQRR